jgi:hypothetical protein
MLNIINMIEDEILHVYRKLDQAKQKIIKNIQKVPLLKLQINMNPFVTLRAGTSKNVSSIPNRTNFIALKIYLEEKIKNISHPISLNATYYMPRENSQGRNLHLFKPHLHDLNTTLIYAMSSTGFNAGNIIGINSLKRYSDDHNGKIVLHIYKESLNDH